MSGCRFQSITRTKPRRSGAARGWLAARLPAPIIPITSASTRARCMVYTDAAAVRSAVGRLPTTIAAMRSASASDGTTVARWSTKPRRSRSRGP